MYDNLLKMSVSTHSQPQLKHKKNLKFRIFDDEGLETEQKAIF